MSDVYEATDLHLGRRVAVKIALPYLSNDPSFGERLRKEAEIVSRLDHPHIAKVYDYGDEDGQPFIVMELVRGTSLKAAQKGNSHLPIDRALIIADDILSALQHAHDRGILHRDVKPENVLLAQDGHAKLVDFGIALAGAQSGITRPGHVVGSIHYIAPERLSGMPASPSSDVYSVGVLLYQMLAGRLPFDGDTPAAVAARQQAGSLAPVSAIRGGMPAWIDSVLSRALASDPGGRFDSAAEMRGEIARLGGAHRDATTEVPVPRGNAEKAPASRLVIYRRSMRDEHNPPVPPPAEKAASSPGNRASIRPILAAIAILLLSGAVLLLGASSRDDSGAGPATLAPTLSPVPTVQPSPTAVPTQAVPTAAPGTGAAPPQDNQEQGPSQVGPPGQQDKPVKGNGRKKR